MSGGESAERGMTEQMIKMNDLLLEGIHPRDSLFALFFCSSHTWRGRKYSSMAFAVSARCLVTDSMTSKHGFVQPCDIISLKG